MDEWKDEAWKMFEKKQRLKQATPPNAADYPTLVTDSAKGVDLLKATKPSIGGLKRWRKNRLKKGLGVTEIELALYLLNKYAEIYDEYK